MQPQIDLSKHNAEVTVEALVSKYRGLTKKTTEAVLETATTIYEADDALNADDKQRFFVAIGLESKSQRAKWLAIAKARGRFERYMDKLPICWTTLYELTKIDGYTFRQIAETRLTASATMKEIQSWLPKDDARSKKATGKASAGIKEPEKTPEEVIVELLRVPKESKEEFLTGLNVLIKKHGLTSVANSDRPLPTGTAPHNPPKATKNQIAQDQTT